MDKKAKTAVIVLLVLAILSLAGAVTAVIVTKNRGEGKEKDPSQTVSSADTPSETQAGTGVGSPSGETQSTEPTEAPSEAPSGAGPVNLEATQAELDELLKSTETKGSLLDGLNMTMLWYDMEDDKHVYCGFDPAAAAPEDYLFCMTHSYVYAYCFGEPQTVAYSESEDPFSNGFEHSYIPYDVEKLNWVSKNVLNLGPVDIDTYTAVQEDGKRYAEYKDGVLYMYYFPYGFESGFGAEAENTQRLADGSYRFTVGYTYYDYGEERDVNGKGTLIAAIREIDSKRIWSILSYTADLYIQ